MNWIFAGVIIFALLEWIAVAKKYKKLEYIVKPATMIALIAWVVSTAIRGGASQTNLNWFVVGMFLCLLGDIFLLLPPEKWFTLELIAFLLGHVSYILGLNIVSLAEGTIIPTICLLLILVVVGVRVFPYLRSGLQISGKEKLIIPVAVYSVAISFMLFSAAYSFLDP